MADGQETSVWTAIIFVLGGVLTVWIGIQGLIEGKISPFRMGSSTFVGGAGVAWSVGHLVVGLGLLAYGVVVLYRRVKGDDS